MRGTKARAIRKQVYGDHSSRPEGREYRWEWPGQRAGKRPMPSRAGARRAVMLVAHGLRRRYQDAKKEIA